MSTGGTAKRLAWYSVLAAIGVAAIFTQLDRYARFEPAGAVLVPAPMRGFAQRQLAVQAIAQGDGVRGTELARDLLRKRPLPAEHLTLFAQAATVDGDQELAVRAIVLSAGRGWRDPVPQEITAEIALADGDYAVAADRIAALWSSGEENERLDDLSGRLLASNAGMQAMARRYGEEGRWQRPFRRALPTFTEKLQRETFLALAGER